MKTLTPKFMQLTPHEERQILRQFEQYVAEILAKENTPAQLPKERKSVPAVEN